MEAQNADPPPWPNLFPFSLLHPHISLCTPRFTYLCMHFFYFFYLLSLFLQHINLISNIISCILFYFSFYLYINAFRMYFRNKCKYINVNMHCIHFYAKQFSLYFKKKRFVLTKCLDKFLVCQFYCYFNFRFLNLIGKKKINRKTFT